MLLATLLVSALAHSTGGSAATVTLIESTRTELKKTVTPQGFSAITESSTSISSKWKMEATVPFSADQWAKLGQDGTLSLKVGDEVLNRKISTGDGFDPKSHSFAFKFSRPVEAVTGFKYLVLPTDPPPTPAPAKGTRLVFAAGSLELVGSTVKITLWSSGNAAPSLAGENFVNLGDGPFEGKLPVELTVGDQSAKVELEISGLVKRKNISNEDKGISGSLVQLSLSGKA
jgi:hypothetical protein